MPHRKNLTARSLSASVQLIERRIYLIRGQKVMLDFDLAELYGVLTKRLNEQVTRNRKRFPEDFMFRLSRRLTDGTRLVIAAEEIACRRHFAGGMLITVRRRPSPHFKNPANSKLLLSNRRIYP